MRLERQLLGGKGGRGLPLHYLGTSCPQVLGGRGVPMIIQQAGKCKWSSFVDVGRACGYFGLAWRVEDYESNW